MEHPIVKSSSRRGRILAVLVRKIGRRFALVAHRASEAANVVRPGNSLSPAPPERKPLCDRKQRRDVPAAVAGSDVNALREALKEMARAKRIKW